VLDARHLAWVPAVEKITQDAAMAAKFTVVI